MNNHLFRIFLLTGLCTLFMLYQPVSAQKGSGSGRGGGSGQRSKSAERKTPAPVYTFITRQEYVKANGIDRQYSILSNPLPAEAMHLEAGRKLYMSRCADCHGVFGEGNGKRIEFIDPSPADLTAEFNLPVSPDAYRYWILALGGARFNTQMPRFKNTLGTLKINNSLQEGKIWQLVLYLQTLSVQSTVERRVRHK